MFSLNKKVILSNYSLVIKENTQALESLTQQNLQIMGKVNML
jgi:hypothetical protein